jgi:pimeloyl-ACP methyl ester carboxylesterase
VKIHQPEEVPMLRRFLAVAAVVFTVGALAPVPAVAADQVPTDQPLPTYSITNPTLAPVLVGGAPSRVLQGVHGHAGYIIEVPPQWNGDLVMWAHGYRGNGHVLTVDPPGYGMRDKLLNQGYAWAASSYYDNGFDTRAGVLSTKDLADHFRHLVGKTHRVYIAGVSMGGYVVGRSVEQYPFFYDGALPMCGVLGDQTLLDFFLDFNLVAQALAGMPNYPLPADYLTAVVPQIQAALGIGAVTPLAPEPANDLGRQLRAITVDRSGGPRPGSAAAFAFWKNFLFSIAVPTSTGTTPAETPGQLSTNVGTVYSPNSPVDVNALVQRVPVANPKERDKLTLTQVPKIFGLPTAPVLSLHGLGDMFVPFSMETAYAADVARFHMGFNVVQRAIRSVNHCEFSNTEVGTAWDDLVRWVTQRVRPAGDAVSDPNAVAAADFGCRFSDRAAYATGTRPLFQPCP